MVNNMKIPNNIIININPIINKINTSNSVKKEIEKILEEEKIQQEIKVFIRNEKLNQLLNE